MKQMKHQIFFYGYSSFLGVWYQVEYFEFKASIPNQTKKAGIQVNGKPMYKKIGNDRVFLSYTNFSFKWYPTPWTMWGGTTPGNHIGNIKIGPKGLNCPEDNPV